MNRHNRQQKMELIPLNTNTGGTTMKTILIGLILTVALLAQIILPRTGLADEVILVPPPVPTVVVAPVVEPPPVPPVPPVVVVPPLPILPAVVITPPVIPVPRIVIRHHHRRFWRRHRR